MVLAVVVFVIQSNNSPRRPAPLQIMSRVPTAVRTQLTPKTRQPAHTTRSDDVVPSSHLAAESKPIRVSVTPGGTDTLQLAIASAYTIQELDSDSSKRSGTSPKPSRVLARAKQLSISQVTSAKKGIQVGPTVFEVDRLEIVPLDKASIRVNGHLYRGRMRLFKRTDGKVSAVNVLPIEEYLASVVDSEMPASFPEEARRAQAIVARTYARYQQEHADPVAVYDLFNSQRSQKYLGVEYTDGNRRRLAGESVSSRKAVADTCGIVLHHEGQLFNAYYSAVCGGRTTHGNELFDDAAPVLKSVPCEWCRDSKYYRWAAEISESDFLKSVTDLKSLAAIKTIKQTAGPGDGNVSQFLMSDGRKSLTISGVELREQLPTGTIRSPRFNLTVHTPRESDRRIIRIAGRGHGHGVGFCQWGAAGQARSGKSGFEIVRHYYPGATLATED
jgi:stage II sporulation protein D